MEEAMLKRLQTMGLSLQDILGRANHGDSKKTRGCRDEWQDSIFERTNAVSYSNRTYITIHFPNPQSIGYPSWRSDRNWGHWPTMLCQTDSTGQMHPVVLDTDRKWHRHKLELRHWEFWTCYSALPQTRNYYKTKQKKPFQKGKFSHNSEL